ncbi:MAG: asparagine synthase (glutamine-hydrolyzing) [Pseudorhodoplanes sp.]|jgi:asparagine synthase (glutamine-hydrolysing)|nr:asparagine synthase (glutamine-hydrolyzing) [Pseudorhodoplanes sp.]
MCGFAALFEQARPFDTPLLDGIDSDLRHRGPDSAGRFVEPGMALVFRRLAIIDPHAASDQPMQDASGRFVVVFNGEIYNFRALRSELEARGVTFRTTGDTEVLLQALIAWNESALDRLEGMYAFVFVDRVEQRVLAARDPFGIKPLYMMQRGGLTAFASEMRPLTRFAGAEPDRDALAELLTFRFAAGKLSNLRGIEKVPGGHLISLPLRHGSLISRSFCKAHDDLHYQDATLTEADADSRAAEAISQSVQDHLQSDVGFCIQLSGGVDSSLVAALSSQYARRPINSFGIDLSPAPNDEWPWRKLVIDQYELEHREVRITGEDYAEALPVAVRAMEGPMAHTGCVLLMLLCRQIAQDHKVVLTGEGADEFFGGYKRYGQWRRIRNRGRIAAFVPSSLWRYLDRWRDYRRFAGRDAAAYATVQGDYLATQEIFPDLVVKRGARESAAAEFSDFRNRLFAVDQSAYLESLLMRQDKLSMASSLEARVPFAHLPLARIVNRFPHRLRAPGDETKPILKRIARRYLPHELIDRRKVGLTVPTIDWLKNDRALGRYLTLLTEPNSRLAALGDRKRLCAAVDAARRGTRHRVPPMDHLIGMELWLRSLEPLRTSSRHSS